MSRGRLGLAALVAIGLAAPAVAADPAWSARKCTLYAEAWDHVRQGGGLDGVGADFVAAQDGFIASGCAQGRYCPRSDAETDLANTLSLMMMNEGVTGSFLPFGCP